MRHHYIPQFMLAPWTKDASDNRLEVIRIDIPKLPSSRLSPKFTAFEKDLYATTIDLPGMPRQHLERAFFSIVDSGAAVARAKMLEHGLSSLTADDRINWARFLMAMRVRQPDVVASIKIGGSEELRRHLNSSPQYEAFAEADDPATMEQWVQQRIPGLVENYGLSLLQGLIDNPEVGKKILAMPSLLCRFPNDCHDLLIADQPCIFSHGIDAPEQIIALPIGPRAAFLAIRGPRVLQNLRRTPPSVLAVRLNESSIDQARARVYARDASARRFIANRLILKQHAKI